MGKAALLRIASFIIILFLPICANAQIAQNFDESTTPSYILDEYKENVVQYTRLLGDLAEAEEGTGAYNAIQEEMAALSLENSALHEIVNEYAVSGDLGNTSLSEDEAKKYDALRDEYIQAAYDNLINETSDSNLDEIKTSINEVLSNASTISQNNETATSSEELDLDEYDDLNRADDGASDWFVSSFITTLKYHLYNFVMNRVFDDLAQETHTFFRLCVAVWLVWTILAATFLKAKVNYMTILMQTIIIMACSTFLSVGGRAVFEEYFYLPALSLFFGLADFFMEKATSASSCASAVSFDGALGKLEQLLASSWVLSDYISEHAPSWWSNPMGFIKAAIFSGLFLLTVGALIFLFAAYWGYAIFAVHVLFALTPIMACLACFKTTRPYAFRWLSGVINYLSIPVILSISMGMTLSIYDSVLGDFMNETAGKIADGGASASESDMDNIVHIFFITLLSFLIHLRVGEISAHLTNGVSTGLSSTWSLGIMAASQVKDLAGTSLRYTDHQVAGTASKVSSGASSAVSNIKSSAGDLASKIKPQN